ncbi:uncharacterized protein LOC126558471 [Anopheles maculipalpis]|uniref:uncharacterized protein LOC126558471 n=1 Tax=Anopheles maculipalpis TaxID=1496333 RepID=UPI00215998B0|nr:uncharacterized protein LOC126558471 [Anopheles maculipalpis]
MVSLSGKKSKSAKSVVKIEKNWEPDVSIPPIISENPDEEGGDEPDDNSNDTNQTKDIVAQLCKQQAIPSDLELQLQEYFKDRPKVKPLPPLESSTVDIDLADSEEETWIIQVPGTVNVEADLIAKKINLAVARSAIKNCSVPLESHVQINGEERVIGLLAGSRVKSFVPTGFVRINQALPELDVPDVAAKTSNPNHITVPYPEELRDRHPLLGYDSNEHMKLPKRVRKQLSFAQQKATLMYQTVQKAPKENAKTVGKTLANLAPATSEQRSVLVKKEPVAESASKIKKQKRPFEELEQEEVTSMVTVKQEPLSPKRKKSKKAKIDEDDVAQTVSVKKEVSVEDDISWLLNI